MSRYIINENTISRQTKDEVEQLSNWMAWIKTQQTYHDGDKKTTVLRIAGKMHDDTDLPEITVPASEFASLAWVPEKWGMTPIIFPASNAAKEIAVAIQSNSEPTKQDIYTHTGWTNINNKTTYLTHSGGITAKGLDDTITVQLPTELRYYSLPKPSTKEADRAAAITASLKIVNLGPKPTTWPLLLSAYRAAIGNNDFAIHLAGRTGTYKSEVASLIQSHYGEAMDARHLPASWTSTPNAIEALAYRAKDAIMVLDDFVPNGTSWQVRQLQKGADQIIRGQGNQSGRSRLTDMSNMQTTFYPRGMLLSTGEDIPDGHSVRGRLFIIELAPDQIDLAKLTAAQAQRHLLPQAMSDWITWLAKTDAPAQHATLAKTTRDQHLGTGHARTPQMIGDLIATATMLAAYLKTQAGIADRIIGDVLQSATSAIQTAANSQKDYLEATDPVTALTETIRQVLGSHMAHARTRNGGVPENAEKWGWTSEKAEGEMPTYKSHGPKLGWIDADEAEFLLDPNAMTLLRKHAGGKLSLTPQTLIKRIKEGGILARTDDARQRNTVRVTIEGHPRQVLAIHLAEIESE